MMSCGGSWGGCWAHSVFLLPMGVEREDRSGAWDRNRVYVDLLCGVGVGGLTAFLS